MAGAPTPRVSEGSPGPSSSPEAAGEFANGAGWPRCTPFSAARPGAAPLSNGAFRTARMERDHPDANHGPRGGSRRVGERGEPVSIHVGGEPAGVVVLVDGYARWLSASDIPKLFINAEPGSILTGPQREFCRRGPNQEEITVTGSHFIQENSPGEIGRAVAAFLARTRA